MVFFFASARAQDFHQMIGDYPFDTTVELDALTSDKIKQNKLSISHQVPVLGTSKIGFSARALELKNDIRAVPDFYNIQFGGSYRRRLDHQRSLGLSVSYGSSSNDPFQAGRDNTILVNGIYKLDEKWVLLGNYSNNRTFLNNVPLPGFLYVQKQSREESVILGFPFISVLKPFTDGIFSLKYIGILPYNHKLRVLFNQLTWFKPYVGLEQDLMVFFETERESRNQRTFWLERKAVVGIEKSFGPFLKLDFQLGNSFDREYFSARSYSRKHTEVKKIHDGVFVSIGLKSSF